MLVSRVDNLVFVFDKAMNADKLGCPCGIELLRAGSSISVEAQSVGAYLSLLSASLLRRNVLVTRRIDQLPLTIVTNTPRRNLVGSARELAVPTGPNRELLRSSFLNEHSLQLQAF